MLDVSISRDDFTTAGTADAGDDHAHTETSYYVTEGWKFGANTLGAFNDGIITWSVGTANFTDREPFDASVAILKFDAAAVIASAFAAWAAVADLKFQQVSDGAGVDIRFGMGAVDGKSDILAYTQTAYTGPLALYADVVFDLAENFSADGAGPPFSFFLVALHEIGHALGLGHEDDVPAVMGTYLNESLTGLTSDDIKGIQSLYGPPEDAQKPASPFKTPDAPVISPPSATPWTPPGGVWTGFASFVDALFYLAHNPDVAASGIAPLDHYLAFGWLEGRDPNPFFDTSFYLNANPDVATAGINPLEHYAEYGWREGRNPSASFDGDKYLQANPDVALVGMDPLAHYLLYGEAEGRPIYPAA